MTPDPNQRADVFTFRFGKETGGVIGRHWRIKTPKNQEAKKRGISQINLTRPWVGDS